MDDFTLRSDGWYAPSKLAGERLDFKLGWGLELASNKAQGWVSGDDTIASAAWIFPTGITHGPESLCADPAFPTASNTGVMTWIAGGTAGQKYTVSVQITSAAGRVEIFSFKIEVK